jgi:ubiquinone/menaquinone biosynthesis C-methylase UbiE
LKTAFVSRYSGKENDMSDSSIDTVFDGSIPKLYDEYFVPIIFEPYAADLVSRLPRKRLSRVLEIAAGTGVVTRALACGLPENVTIVATDLNEGMLEQAKSSGTRRPVEWKQADVMALPFPEENFDAVLCQFGAMFFPDKAKAFAQVRRVLRPGGIFLFNVWDRIEENEFADVITKAMGSLFPDDPPRFLERIPHGYYLRETIERDLVAGGFGTPEFTTVTKRSHADSPRTAAVAYCEGTPLRNEIEARNPSLLRDATVTASDALAQRFGARNITGKIQAHVLAVRK